MTTPIQIHSSPQSRVQIEVSPNPAFADEEVAVRVSGLAPREPVTIRARARDDAGSDWHSYGVYLANTGGSVDLSANEVTEGTYRGRDAMGLFWSMKLDSSARDSNSAFRKESTAADKVSLMAEIAGKAVATAEFERRWLAPGTQTREARGEGLVAQLLIPPGSGRHRAVIVLGGSGGGYDVDKAALLARHGFAAFALAYFGIPPLPQWLHRVPLEYFQRAFEWLRRQPEIDANRIGVLGISRGAEAALLAASAFPEISAVVAYSPSAVAWGSGGRDKVTGEIIPCWTFQGQPVSFAPLPLRVFIARSAVPVALFRRPVKFRNLFRVALRNRQAVERGIIPAERAGGPILLISGGDDHVWPAAQMAEMLVKRLRARGFVHPLEHLHYPKAGHALRYPFMPTTARTSRPAGLKYPISLGGTAHADAEAQGDAWRRTIAFLDRHL